MKKNTLKRQVAESIREIVFGLEDSLVSTLGAITGIAVGTQSTYIVILSGLVLIAAEGMSMAAGSYLSSKSSYDADKQLHKEDGKSYDDHFVYPIRSAFVMGIFYFIGGFVPLMPYFFTTVKNAMIPSIVITAITLFMVGVWASGFTKRSPVKSGAEMAGVSLAAAFVGYIIGMAVSSYFGVTVTI